MTSNDDSDPNVGRAADPSDSLESSSGPQSAAVPGLHWARTLWNSIIGLGSGVADRLDRWWAKVTTHVDDLKGRDVVTSFAVVGYVVLNSARSALDAGIRKIHPVGVDGVGVNTLHHGGRAIDNAFETWEDGYARLAGFVRYEPTTLATAQTLLELALVPFSGVLLFGIGRHLRRGLAGTPGADVMSLAMLGAVGYFVLGVFNQVAELWILQAGGQVSGLTSILAVTGPGRLYVLAFVMAPLVAGLVRAEWAKPAGERLLWWRSTGTTYRVLIAVALLHAALLLFSIPGKQTADALRLWVIDWHLGVYGLLSTLTLAATLGVYATRLGASVRPARKVLARAGTRRLIGGSMVVAVVGSLAVARSWAFGPVALASGLIGLGVGLLSWPLATLPESIPEDDIVTPSDAVKERLPAILATVPLTALAISLVQAAVPSIMDRSTSGKLIVWAACAAIMAVVAYPVVRRSTSHAISANRQRNAPYRGYVTVLNAIWIVMVVFLVTDPYNRGPIVGVITIMATFLVALVAVFGTIGNFMESRALPAALDFVGFRRLPVLLTLVLLAVVSQSIAGDDYHDVVAVAGTRPEASQLTIDDAFGKWVGALDPTATPTDQPAATRGATPLVFVTAAGGGIKAAAFTAAVLDCVFAPTAPPVTTSAVTPSPLRADGCATQNTWNDVFVTSGASGGSVGIASVLAESGNAAHPDEWVVARLGHDLLSPSITWQLLVEAPNAVAAFHPADDRAFVLEETWRRRFDLKLGDTPFYVARDSAGWSGPLAFFSGTNLNDGCRVNISAVRAGVNDPTASPNTASEPLPAGATLGGSCTERRQLPAEPTPDQGDTRDIVDYLCDDSNIDLATAAFLSARFPYVSPTGTVTCHGETIAVGDGGYRDNSGASTIVDTWSVLEPLVERYNETHDRCVVPILLEIATGYAGLTAPEQSSNAAQLVAPAIGAAAVFGDLSYGQIEQAAAEFRRSLGPDLEARVGGTAVSRHFRVSLVEHPGVTAPLGWSLSDAAVRDFIRQLQLPENSAAVASLASIMSNPDALTCARTS